MATTWTITVESDTVPVTTSGLDHGQARAALSALLRGGDPAPASLGAPVREPIERREAVAA